MIGSRLSGAWWTWLVIALAIPSAAFGCSKSAADTKTTDKDKKKDAPEDDFEEVKLKSWLEGVKKDKIAFTDKWRGKDIKFDGVVDDILDSAPEHWVFVWPGTGEKGMDYPEIICVVKSAKETAKWAKDDKVVVKGTVFGPMGMADNVQLFRCAVEKGASKGGDDDDDKGSKKKKKSKDEDE